MLFRKIAIASSALAIAAASTAAFAQSRPATPVQDAGPCGGISGYYGNVTALTIGPDGKAVTITMANDRPLAYGLCTGAGNINVNFKSPDENYQGTYDAATKTIRWTNGTTWTKAPMCWVGGDASVPACK